MTLNVGDPVIVVEHDEATQTPRPEGHRHSGRVAVTGGLYIEVAYDDRALNRGRPDVFYKESLWRAWDGALRWRLMSDLKAER